MGLIASLLIVFYLKQIGIAWTWFVGISVMVNISITFIIEGLYIEMSKVETSFKVLDQFSNSSTKIPYIVVDNFPKLGF
jgi:hypothetical protein